MSAPTEFESAPVPSSGLPGAHHQLKKETYKDEKDAYAYNGGEEVIVGPAAGSSAGDFLEPNEDQLSTLRRVSAPMPMVVVLMCLIELAERASYYGCSQGPFANFVKNPLPKGGNGAGAVAPGAAGKDQSAGALGLGSVDASALTQLFKFLSYVIPIFGGIIADTKWGRFKTLCVGTAIGGIAHIILVIPAIPAVIKNANGALGAFTISIIILAFGAGFIKPCLAPLLCDQSPVKVPQLKTLKSGELVILDPQVTVQRYLNIFYWCINVGAFFALATVYSERFVGFWLAFLEPGIVYMVMPIVLVFAYKRLYKAPPQGSVFMESCKVIRVLFSNGGWKRCWRGGEDFWVRAKPSYIEARDGHVDTDKVFWDDKFVDEIRQTASACMVFALLPIFQLADGGIGNQMNDMSVAMTLDGVPNDVINNWNPLTIIVFTPILTWGFYPLMAKMGFPLRPMTRMSIGFVLGMITMIISAIIQWRVYETSPCGYYASDNCAGVSPISLWWQIPIYSIPAIGELFAIITSYEIAYTRAPARMKSLVYAFALFPSAVSAAISLACSAAIKDPDLIWPYVALAVACAICAALCPTYLRHLTDFQSDFANVERAEGRQQPKYQAEHADEKALANSH